MLVKISPEAVPPLLNTSYVPGILPHDRPIAMGWHGVANAPWATGCQHFATPGNFFAIFYYCFISVVKEKSPEILVELNLGLSDILESSIVSSTHYPIDCDNIY